MIGSRVINKVVKGLAFQALLQSLPDLFNGIQVTNIALDDLHICSSYLFDIAGIVHGANGCKNVVRWVFGQLSNKLIAQAKVSARDEPSCRPLEYSSLCMTLVLSADGDL